MIRRAFDWVLIVALTGVWAVLFARGVGEGLRTQRGFIDVRVSSAGIGDYPTVQDAPIFAWRLLPGDRLTAVDGADLRDATQLDFYDRTTRAARERGYTAIRVERGGAPFEARVELTPREGWWLGFVVQVIGMVVSTIVFVRAPDRRFARLLFASAWAWIAFTATMDTQQGWRGTRGEVGLAGTLLIAFSVLTIWIAQEFTASARPVPRAWRAIPVTAGVVIAAMFVVRTSFPHTWRQAVLSIGVSLGFMVAATLAGLTRSYLRATSLERRRIRWVVLGFYIAFVGNFVATELAVIGARMTARVLAPFSTAALYAGILASVVGYRWLDVDRLISAAASYTIVGLAALGAALAFAPSVAASAAPALGIEPAVAQWLLAMALLLAALPAHVYLRPRLDRRLFSDRHERVSGLEQLIDSVGSCRDTDALWELTSERIDTLLEPESLVAYAREGDRFNARFARGRSESPSWPADSVLVRALAGRGRPLAAEPGQLEPFDRAALETLGVALVVPIGTRDSLLGFACLGRKRSGDIYTREEMALLAAIALRCAEVLRPAPAPAVELPRVFRLKGSLWTLASNGKEVHLRDMRGMHYLRTLLREPGREFAALDLVRAANGVPFACLPREPELTTLRGDLGDAGPTLDAQARAEYRARLAELDEELADAERCADLGRLERTSEEREALIAELESSSRSARPGSDAERARVAVTKAFRLALEKIADAHPELGAHLAATVRRGHACAYKPDPRAPVDWEV